MSIDQWQQLLGTMTLINIGILLLSTVVVSASRKLLQRLHGSLFKLEPGKISEIAYQYLGTYKLLIIVFNLVPWIALQLL